MLLEFGVPFFSLPMLYTLARELECVCCVFNLTRNILETGLIIYFFFQYKVEMNAIGKHDLYINFALTAELE